MGEQSNGQESWDVLPQMTKCSLVWKGFTASALCPALVKGWEREKQRKTENKGKGKSRGGKGDGEKGRGEDIKPRSRGEFFVVCSLKGGQDFM